MKFIIIFLMSFLLCNSSFAAPVCEKLEDACVDGPATKTISGFDVYRDCWKYKSTYQCEEGNSLDNCGKLRSENCFEIESNCKTMHKDKCIEQLKKFRCIHEEKYMREEERSRIVDGNEKIVYSCKGEIPHLDGAYADKSYENNKDMMSAISQMSILAEMQGQMKDELSRLFKGSVDKCEKAQFGFKNCCGSGKGWGVSLKMGTCAPEDQQTVEKRNKGLCHEVGEYCSEDVPVVGCVCKKRSYCCFPSKIAKALQEQGRAQLGKGWGSARNPDCSGLTKEEIAQIDFSKLNLEELYQDLLKDYKAPDVKRLNSSMKNELNQMQKEFRDNSKDDFQDTTKGINKKYLDKKL